ncbi:unnamed protein product [Adineta steineri]|uniref:Catalase core domain-containing protein n=1 Tax=Adineta steineri TaxID=433720 RepID=A0A813MT74_9BILA|nr:unnamed protein product [Adineta steineri]
MEGGSSIMKRIAGRDNPQVLVDAQSNPVNVDKRSLTTIIDAQSGLLDHPVKSTMIQKEDNQTNKDSSLIGTVTSLLKPLSGNSDVPPTLTSVNGYRLGDATHCLNINGYPVVSDGILFEKQQTFNRSKIVERAVHACGSGAFGYFEVTHDVSSLCKADFLSKVGKITPVMIRFSTTTYGREFPDSARNPRGIAMKFYTDEGNYDILSINFPVFFVRDPIQGPDVIRSQQRNPNNFRVNWDATLDFMSLVPEGMLGNTWYWSDHGTPVGWRHMDAFPIHTFKWVNSQNEHVYIRYKFSTTQGVKNFTDAEAIRMCGEDPDYAKRDLWQHLDNGGTHEFKCQIQMMDENDIKKITDFDPFDATKIWPEDRYPLIEFGRLVLDRNPENYHRDVEQVAFSPGSLVPGIEPSPDALLQFRMFLYRDAQLYRLGVNLHQIPVNCPFMTRQHHPSVRDGRLRCDANGGVEPNYYPNSFSQPPHARPDLTCNEKPVPLQGHLARKSHSCHENQLPPDAEYVQARQFYLHGLNHAQRANLYHNIAKIFPAVSRLDIKLRFLVACYKVHPDYVRGILALYNEITFQQVEQAAMKLQDKHTVDRTNGYEPYDLS